jgi:hypothetical protein
MRLANLWVYKTLPVLIVLLLCSCNSRPSHGISQLTLTSESTPSVVPTTSPLPLLATITIEAPKQSTTFYSESQVYCSLYIQSQNERQGPHSLTFDELENLFVTDPANNRILMYPPGTKVPHIINVPPSYVLDYNSNTRYWSNASVSNGNIYLVFDIVKNRRIIQKMAILSFDGREQQIIDLEPYYPSYTIFSPPIMADRHGGVYLGLSLGGLSGGNSLYEYLVVGWDGNLYSYDFSTDNLNNWGPSEKTVLITHGEPLSSMDEIITATQDKDSAYGRLVGVDSSGRLYFSFRGSNGSVKIIRLSEDSRVIGTIPEEWATYFLYPSLSPDGSLYSLVNNSRLQSTQPGIVKCNIE